MPEIATFTTNPYQSKLEEGRVKVLRPMKHHDVLPTLIMLAEEALSKDDGDLIILEHEKLSLSKVDIGDGNVVTPHNKELLNNQVPWKYDLNNMRISVIPHETRAFNTITEIVDSFMPKNEDYGMITYMTIQEYPTGTFFATHKDDAESNDTATVVFTLNDTFEGGRFQINGHSIAQRLGSMIAFNNNTKILHSVEPITKGTRFALCIWFCSFEELTEDAESNT